jgi:hypothetical protein
MEWRTIPGYPAYKVSNTGDVIGYQGILRPTTVDGGYKRLNLHRDGKLKSFLVSRLVALAFIPNPENKPEVDHINRIRSDNRVENLRWATRGDQNVNRAYKPSNTGHRNISKRRGRSTYDVRIMRHDQVVFYKYCKTLDEAIQARDMFLTQDGLVSH